MIRYLRDWGDALIYTWRSWRITEAEMARRHEETLNDPEVEAAVKRAYARKRIEETHGD